MKKLIILLMMLAGAFACTKDNPVTEPVTMTLYDKPLSTIQKAIEGKWKVYSRISNGFLHNVIYPENWYMKFGNDIYVSDNNGDRDTVSYTWEKHSIEDWMSPLNGYTTYMMCYKQNDHDKLFLHSINNDTLDFGHYSISIAYRVVRVK